MSDSNNTSKGDIGFCGLLAIAFIVLKIPSAIGIVLLIILIILKVRWMR